MTRKTPDNVCPRCVGFIPSNERPGEYMGAISRIDNTTEICSECGTEEALLLLADTDNWPVFLFDFPEERIKYARQRSAEALAVVVALDNQTEA
jgi:hypothetical protein